MQPEHLELAAGQCRVHRVVVDLQLFIAAEVELAERGARERNVGGHAQQPAAHHRQLSEGRQLLQAFVLHVQLLDKAQPQGLQLGCSRKAFIIEG